MEMLLKSDKQEPWLDIVGQLSQNGGTLDVGSYPILKTDRRQGFRALVH